MGYRFRGEWNERPRGRLVDLFIFRLGRQEENRPLRWGHFPVEEFFKPLLDSLPGESFIGVLRHISTIPRARVQNRARLAISTYDAGTRVSIAKVSNCDQSRRLLEAYYTS
jgi:hypothetical protein